MTRARRSDIPGLISGGDPSARGFELWREVDQVRVGYLLSPKSWQSLSIKSVRDNFSLINIVLKVCKDCRRLAIPVAKAEAQGYDRFVYFLLLFLEVCLRCKRRTCELLDTVSFA
jgi:hypothetical protein